MLIHPPSNSIVLQLREPSRVLSVIPTAKAFTADGLDLVAVPHRLDEVRVLRNMGIKAPSPIKYQYDWPRHPNIVQPFVAQKETAEFLTYHPSAFVLNDLGTGKTLAALWAYHFLKTRGQVRKLLIVSPLSTLERTWAKEVFENFTDLSYAVLHGSKERRLKMLSTDVDVYIVNHHGLNVLKHDLVARKDIDVVVIDEVATFRNASTVLWKSAKAVIKDRAYVWGMTGTPTPNAPTDAWGQCRLLAPERVPTYFGGFRDAVMKQMGPFKWVARESATEIVANAMQPAIRFRREDCVDLPPAIYQTRSVPMTPEQTSAYKDMLSKLHMEYEGGQVLAVNEAVKMGKLLQIAAGVVYGAGAEEVLLPCKPRIDEVLEIIEQAGTKVIVFVPYKASLRHVAAELGKHHTVGMISGDVSATQRNQVFKEFQDPRSQMKVLVAQPAAMSHGLTLTSASTIVWFSAVTSQETYTQANGRITRPGQKHTQFIIMIEGSAVERKLYDRLEHKKKMEGVLLDAIREGV